MNKTTQYVLSCIVALYSYGCSGDYDKANKDLNLDNDQQSKSIDTVIVEMLTLPGDGVLTSGGTDFYVHDKNDNHKVLGFPILSSFSSYHKISIGDTIIYRLPECAIGSDQQDKDDSYIVFWNGMKDVLDIRKSSD